MLGVSSAGSSELTRSEEIFRLRNGKPTVVDPETAVVTGGGVRIERKVPRVIFQFWTKDV